MQVRHWRRKMVWVREATIMTYISTSSKSGVESGLEFYSVNGAI